MTGLFLILLLHILLIIGALAFAALLIIGFAVYVAVMHDLDKIEPVDYDRD
jgi:hypothetical protein